MLPFTALKLNRIVEFEQISNSSILQRTILQGHKKIYDVACRYCFFKYCRKSKLQHAFVSPTHRTHNASVNYIITYTSHFQFLMVVALLSTLLS